MLEVIADKTGYPPEMLDLDSDLEADLGIDTVKQAETFAAVREAFDIPRRDDVKLRDYPTLASVIKFVYDSRPDLAARPTTKDEGPKTAPAPAAAPAAAPATAPTVTPSVTSIGTLADADKMPRRVPVPSLRPALDLCQPTGVTLDENSRVVVMLDQGGVGKALVNRLQKRNVTTLVIDEPLSAEALTTRLKAWLSEGAIQGVYWLTALDVEPALEDMDLAGWREANRVRVKNLYTAMRALYDSVHGPNTFLVSATRLGGLHGYGETGASAPLGGAVSGFTKAYRMEKMLGEGGKGSIVKAVDFETGRKTAEPADQLIAETLTDPGIVEVGYHNGQRYTVTLVEKPARDGQPGMDLNQDTVFVVTGAAGGITSAIVTDLALASKGVFYLLDLVAAPAHDDENVRLFRTDREALKRKLIDEARGHGERPTPAMIDKQIMGIERNEAALRAVEAVEAAGGTAHYFSLDLRDGEAVSKVVDDIRARYGRIDVLLHAGGLLIDRTLPNKEPQQFDLVFDVKADGFFSLIKAAKGLPIGATVSFSSVAGRFGNNGQTDYSSANDLLCKISSSMRGWRPDTRGIAIDWTAWGQIGMASRGSVPAIMEALGVDMLPAESGVPTIRRELTYGDTRGEIVVAGRLGAWLQENAPAGGLAVDKAAQALAATQPPALMVGEVSAARLYGGLEAETTLDPKAQPFLYDHQIDGVPVLPGVMGTEAFAELASVAAPGYRVASIDNISLSSPFKFHRHQPRTLYLSAVTAPADGDLVAHTSLRSVTQPKPELPPQVREHFTADVRLTQVERPTPTVSVTAPPAAEGRTVGRDDVYKVYFHGPAYQVLEKVQVTGDRSVGLMAENLPANTAPDGVASIMAPRLIELCFQTAGMWEILTRGMMALPAAIEAVTTYRQPEEADGQRLTAYVTVRDGGQVFDAQVVDESGNLYVDMRGYRTAELGPVKL